MIKHPGNMRVNTRLFHFRCNTRDNFFGLISGDRRESQDRENFDLKVESMLGIHA